MRVRNIRLTRETLQDRKALYEETIERLKSQQQQLLAAEGLSESGEYMEVDEDE